MAKFKEIVGKIVLWAISIVNNLGSSLNRVGSWEVN